MSKKLVSELKDNINQCLKSASKDVNILRYILSEAQSIALKDKRKELQDSDIISAAIKCKKEGAEGMDIYKNLTGKVADDNYTRNRSLELLASLYLPTQLTSDEVNYKIAKIISDLNASTMKDMGKVMKQFKDENPVGTYDAKIVSCTVRQSLN
jgi:uncharacterized protein YqeY